MMCGGMRRNGVGDCETVSSVWMCAAKSSRREIIDGYNGCRGIPSKRRNNHKIVISSRKVYDYWIYGPHAPRWSPNSESWSISQFQAQTVKNLSSCTSSTSGPWSRSIVVKDPWISYAMHHPRDLVSTVVVRLAAFFKIQRHIP